MPQKIILCVDDEKMVLDALVSQLQKELAKDYLIEIAEDAPDAWDIIYECEAGTQTLALIISDWLMPIQKGDEFLISVSQKHPHIPLIMLSGHVDEQSLKRTQNYSNLKKFIRKPWDKEDLLQSIRQFAL